MQIEQHNSSQGATWQLTSNDLSLVVDELGASISRVVVRQGSDRRLISVDRDSQAPSYHGASVGRWANRIANAHFSLDGVGYELASNEGPNQLHGGPDGFHARRWRGAADVDGGRGIVELELTSPGGDQGFPGSLAVTATIALAGSRLTIDYRATTDAPTPVNITSHLYWNLGGPGPLDGHLLTVGASRYVAVDDAKIPLPGPPATVDGTRFDCRAECDVAAIVAGGGYDHCFLLHSPPRQIVLAHRNGLRLDVSTNQMGAQIYTGQHLDPRQRAIAIEPQRVPDMVNRPEFGDPILRPGDEYRSSTTIDVSA